MAQLFPADIARGLPVTLGVLDFIDRRPFVSEKPYTIAGPLPPEKESLRTNLVTDPRRIPLRDLRGVEAHLSIEKNGFEIVNLAPPCSLATVDDESIQVYLSQFTDWLRDRLSAQHCFCYAYKASCRRLPSLAQFRSSEQQNRPAGSYSGTRGTPDEPAPLPHIDHTKNGGPRRIRNHLTEDEQRQFMAEGRRLRVFTIWRPINAPVEDYPLAICSGFSVDEGDLVPADRITSQRVGEVYYIAHSDKQEWYWLSGQTPDEMTVFNSYDSHRDFGLACGFLHFCNFDY